MTDKTGGPAFPIREIRERSGYNFLHGSSGMTLRDYFAAKAMQAIVSDSRNMSSDFNLFDDPVEGICKVSYKFADAMLQERAKHGQE